MSIVVYHLGPGFREGTKVPYAKTFASAELVAALAEAERLRKDGFTHVTISTELEESVGKPGVTSIVHGKTPDGIAYEWSKQHRGDGPRKM